MDLAIPNHSRINFCIVKMEEDLLECGHCIYKTRKISKLEQHLKTKHTKVKEHTTPDEDDEIFLEIEKETISFQHQKSVSDNQRRNETDGTSISAGNKEMNIEKEREYYHHKLENGIKRDVTNCDFVGDNLRAVGIHKSRSHKKNKSWTKTLEKLICSRCQFACHDRKTLKTHLICNHKLRLDDVDKETNEAYNSSSSSQNENGKKFKCSECSFVGFSGASLSVHVYRAHKSKEKSDPGANKSINRSLGLKNEEQPKLIMVEKKQQKVMSTKLDLKRSESNFIGFGSNKSSLIDHVQQSHTVNDFDAEYEKKKIKRNEVDFDVCNTIKAAKEESNQHIFSDVTDILQTCIKCPVCSFMCNSLRSMGEHVATVHSSRSGGGFGMTVIDQLVERKMLDDGTIKNGEIIVDKQIGDCSTSDLKNEDKLTGVKCDICGKKYSNRANLKRHLTLNHTFSETPPNNFSAKSISPPKQVRAKSSTPSSCKECKKTFSSFHNLLRHNRNFHPNGLVDCEIIQKSKRLKTEPKAQVQ